MSIQQPAMTSMMAAPTYGYGASGTYAAAPTMTSMYASPSASMYTPATTTVAAPQYVQQPQFAQPQAYSMEGQIYASAAPVNYVTESAGGALVFGGAAPVKLTEGLVTPAKLEQERLAYEKALAAQLAKQSDAVFAEAAIKKQMLEQATKTQLAQFQLQAEEQLKLSLLQVDSEALMTVDGLKEAAITQQTSREEAAARAVADYNKKAALDEYAQKSYDVQKSWVEKETALNAEYQKVMADGSSALRLTGHL